MTQVLLILFVIFPAAEIAMFSLVDSAIGLWATVFLVALTGVWGLSILGRAGLAPLGKKAWADQDHPFQEMMEAALLVVSGLLLVTPGFLTDGLGLFLLAPSMRRTTAALLFRRQKHRTEDPASSSTTESYTGQTVEINAEYREIPAGYDRMGQGRPYQ